MLKRQDDAKPHSWSICVRRIAATYSLLIACSLFADSVHMRDGSVLTGTIVRQTQTEIFLRTANGNVSVRKDAVKRIVFQQDNKKEDSRSQENSSQATQTTGNWKPGPWPQGYEGRLTWEGASKKCAAKGMRLPRVGEMLRVAQSEMRAEKPEGIFPEIDPQKVDLSSEAAFSSTALRAMWTLNVHPVKSEAFAVDSQGRALLKDRSITLQTRCVAPDDLMDVPQITQTGWSEGLGSLPWDEAGRICQAMGMRLPAPEEIIKSDVRRTARHWTWDLKDNQAVVVHHGSPKPTERSELVFAQCVRLPRPARIPEWGPDLGPMRWSEARDSCRDQGLRLPTETELKKAQTHPLFDNGGGYGWWGGADSEGGASWLSPGSGETNGVYPSPQDSISSYHFRCHAP